MDPRRTLTNLCLVAACAAAIGCGSDDGGGSAKPAGEQAAVAAVVKSYLGAMGRLDAAGACATLTSRGQRQLVAESGSKQRSCEEVLRLGFQLLTPEQKQVLAEQSAIEPYDIAVSGRNASGQLQFRGQVSQFQAEKVAGVWKLASPGEQQIAAG
jgi:hypothetical protein